MFTDAMTAGVNPGGLQSRTEIRVLICYLLHNSISPLPLETVKEQLHFNGITNYFETAFAISDLEEGNTIIGTVEEDGLKYYTGSGDCKHIATSLGNSLPFSVREDAMDICKLILERKRNERANNFFVEKTEYGIYVTCAVMENDHELVSVKLLVPDEASANSVKENFLSNPVQVLLRATEGLTNMKL